MNTIVIAVDTGNWNVKTAIADPFPTGVTHHGTVPPPMQSQSLYYEGQYYSICEDRVQTRQDKTMDKEYFILVLAAIARELQAVLPNQKDYKNSVALAMGLPVTHLSLKVDGQILRARYKEFFSNGGKPICFQYEGIPYNITIIDVGVFAQTMAALLANESVLEQARAANRSYLIDIGGGTTNIIRMVKGRPENPGYTFEDKGILTLYKQIRRRVFEDCGKNIDDFMIDAILSGKQYVTEDVTAVIAQTTIDFVAELVLCMRSHGIDLDMSFLVFVGGGSVLLYDYIKAAIGRNDTVLISDIKSNAIGYELQELMLLERTIGIKGVLSRNLRDYQKV